VNSNSGKEYRSGARAIDFAAVNERIFRKFAER